MSGEGTIKVKEQKFNRSFKELQCKGKRKIIGSWRMQFSKLFSQETMVSELMSEKV